MVIKLIIPVKTLIFLFSTLFKLIKFEDNCRISTTVIGFTHNYASNSSPNIYFYTTLIKPVKHIDLISVKYRGCKMGQ